jgi:hypothetical protein
MISIDKDSSSELLKCHDNIGRAAEEIGGAAGKVNDGTCPGF